MKSILADYRQLLAMSQLYLLREFPPALMTVAQSSAPAQPQLPKISKIESTPSMPQQPKVMPTPEAQESSAPATVYPSLSPSFCRRL